MQDVTALGVGSMAAIALGLLEVARRTRRGDRLPWSFGDGFLGFRGYGWPRGVQEDDDARWTWTDRPTSPDLPPALPVWLAHSHAVPPSRPQRH